MNGVSGSTPLNITVNEAGNLIVNAQTQNGNLMVNNSGRLNATLQHHSHNQTETHNGSSGNVINSSEIVGTAVTESQVIGELDNASNARILSSMDSKLNLNVAANSASGIIQALGAAFNQVVAAGNVTSMMPTSLSMPINQGAIVGGSDIITIPSNLLSGSAGNPVVETQQQQIQVREVFLQPLQAHFF